MSIEEVLEEFEKATETVVDVKPRISPEDKKSAKKRKFTGIFVIAGIAAAVIVSTVILYYAANNNVPDNNVDSNIVDRTENELNAPVVSEEDSSEELTTVATTAATTEKITVATTERTTVATTERTTVSTTAATTAATTQGTTSVNSTEAPTGEYAVHTVKYGDNYYSILRQYGIKDSHENVRKFCAYNGITPATNLYLGQQLKVPYYLK